MQEEKTNIDNSGENLRAMSSETSSVVGSEYTVEERDTIPSLEEKLGVSWQDIYEANKDIIKDTNTLQPGTRLKIPKK